MQDGFENTVLGLLRKRSELLSELEHHKNQLGKAMNNLNALDRVLNSLGYEGALELTPPRNKVLTYVRQEIRKIILELLRDAGEAMTTRELTIKLAIKEGRDIGDRHMMVDLSKRVSKSLCILLDKQIVRRYRVPGEQANRYEMAR